MNLMLGKVNKQPTLKDMGLRLGLSARAISQALSESEGTVKVSAATREKVQALAKKLGYRHNGAAKALRTGRTGTLGVLSFQSFSPFAVQRIHYALREIKKRPDFTPLVYHSDLSDEESPIRACNAMLDARADGVLILGPSANFTQHLRLLKAGIPVTVIGQPYLTNVPKFIADKKTAFTQLANHLVEEGYKSLTFLGGPAANHAVSKNWHLDTLTEGFRAAAKRAQRSGRKVKFDFHHLPPPASNDQVWAFEQIHTLYAPGYIGMWEMIKSGNVPEALMCQVDTWALGAMRACAEAGISVPQGMALTGFEDDLVSAVGAVPLTSVAQPHEELCARAVNELMGLIKGELKLTDRIETLPCHMTIRQSSVRRKLPSIYTESPGDGNIF